MSTSTQVHELFTKFYDPVTCEVHVGTSRTLEQFKFGTPAKEWERFERYAASLQGKKVMFVNATYAGGGVAIMRAPLIALLRLMGVDAHWYVLRPDLAASIVTKRKFHNVLQGVAEPGVELTEADKAVYEAWIAGNAALLRQPLSEADVIGIDDWQPSLLIRYIRGDDDNPGFNPGAKILFRDHIHTEGALMGTPGTPQHAVWDYIWNHNRVCEADLFITHPMDFFVPPNVPDRKVVFMPAASCLVDDLLRELSPEEMSDGLRFVNDQLALHEDQLPIDPTRPYLAKIARFCPAKGMEQTLETYALARRALIDRGVPLASVPQLVIVGNGSVDDPDGAPMLEKMMRLRRERYSDIADDIKIARLPHNDIAINAVLRGAFLLLHQAIKEGFEMRVTDAILLGVPVLGSNRGGIPLQIIDGHSGHIIDPFDVKQWAARICELVLDQNKYLAMRTRTRALATSHNHQFTAVPNAISWLHLFGIVLSNAGFEGNRSWVSALPH